MHGATYTTRAPAVSRELVVLRRRCGAGDSVQVGEGASPGRGTGDASHAVVRWVLLVLLGCAQPLPPSRLPELAPPPEPPNLIDARTYESRVATLRATLARSHIDLDAGPVIKACGSHHGIDDCFTCEIVRRLDTSDVDPDMIDAVAIAFAHYPTNVLKAAKLEHVSLCRRIRYDHNDAVNPSGLAMADDRRLMISIEQFSNKAHEAYGNYSIEQVVHHELFHMLDHATNGEKVNADREWHALLPAGFAYRDPAPLGGIRPSGFVNNYATTNELEDRATVYEYMMGQPEELCALAAADPRVAAKARLVRARVARLMGESRLPHCERKPPTPKKVGPLAPRPPSIMGRMR